MQAPEWYRPAFGAHYPLLYQHRDLAEARQCLELLPELAPLGRHSDDRILDLGCGDGRHLVELLRSGLDGVGLDLSWPLLARARDRLGDSGASHLIRGDMRCLPLGSGSMTSVLSLFTAFGYLGALEANEIIVQEVARVLRPGGHWFLDYFDGDAVRAELNGTEPMTRQRELAPLLVQDTRRLGDAASTVLKDVRLTPLAGCEDEARALGIGPGGLRYREEVAVFSLEEMDLLAGSHDLDRVAGAGSYGGAPLGRGDRWILVFRKQGNGSRKDP